MKIISWCKPPLKSTYTIPKIPNTFKIFGLEYKSLEYINNMVPVEHNEYSHNKDNVTPNNNSPVKDSIDKISTKSLNQNLINVSSFKNSLVEDCIDKISTKSSHNKDNVTPNNNSPVEDSIDKISTKSSHNNIHVTPNNNSQFKDSIDKISTKSLNNNSSTKLQHDIPSNTTPPKLSPPNHHLDKQHLKSLITKSYNNFLTLLDTFNPTIIDEIERIHLEINELLNNNKDLEIESEMCRLKNVRIKNEIIDELNRIVFD